MKYYATKHLKERLFARNIELKDVEYCIENYHSDYANKGNNQCHYYIADIKGHNLKVLVDKKSKTIVTAFWMDTGSKEGLSND